VTADQTVVGAHPPPTADGLPHRSARVAAQCKHRVSNPEVQEQNVLMRKWHVTSVQRSPDAEALRFYNEVYQSQLGASQCWAIRALFMTACPPPQVEVLDLEP
jgi:hypothetical protein